MPTLSDGTIVPSFLSVNQTEQHSQGSYFGNAYMIKGEVIKIIYPQDSDSNSGQFIEYNVYIDNRNNGTGNNEILHNCSLSNGFAGLADKSAITLRAASQQPWKTGNGYSDGSKVLVLCVNGESTKPTIIGGLRDIADTSEQQDTADDPGLHAFWLFNGINTSINQDGELSVVFEGPTKNDGTLDTDKVDQDSTGTSFTITKNGNAELATPDDKQHVLLDHENNKTEHLAGTEFKLTVTDGKFLTDSNGVELGAQANDALLLGTTQRKAEQLMNQKLSAMFDAFSKLILTAGTQLNAAAALAVPSGAGPGLAAAGAALLASQSIILNLKVAIDAYEDQAPQYLSTVNFTE